MTSAEALQFFTNAKTYLLDRVIAPAPGKGASARLRRQIIIGQRHEDVLNSVAWRNCKN